MARDVGALQSHENFTGGGVGQKTPRLTSPTDRNHSLNSKVYPLILGWARL